ncbi:hypothetical protein SODALDRAFT_402236 [Sodiomyces alkalinus F11]|uniref:P-loop containing nucleoside triphosphate hydrolase protein n=1 Tax=Sodiomyces alkalinus (strain CBS 110278 / VKM F-3762 / F11) TaxID=1314773 RepID=A0A3N2PP67_SODAK|nr:hypothetical protein SODALDRAFT_402236 [Sodiomyces alkalinus F11]ROT36321.1 hypothetical protein SODALDRAFT_402236 [Sodiomyces alkalinus F11]
MGFFIYINGLPNVGKLTIAKKLWQVVSHHLLIDPVAAVFKKDDPEYQPLARALREELLESIATSESTRDVTWIFTDQQPSSELASSIAKDYETAAMIRDSPFISVILTCEEPEETSTKANIAVLDTIKEEEGIFHFHNDMEMELDITTLSPAEASQKVFEHVCRCAKSVETNGDSDTEAVNGG